VEKLRLGAEEKNIRSLRDGIGLCDYGFTNIMSLTGDIKMLMSIKRKTRYRP